MTVSVFLGETSLLIGLLPSHRMLDGLGTELKSVISWFFSSVPSASHKILDTVEAELNNVISWGFPLSVSSAQMKLSEP